MSYAEDWLDDILEGRAHLRDDENPWSRETTRKDRRAEQRAELLAVLNDTAKLCTCHSEYEVMFKERAHVHMGWLREGRACLGLRARRLLRTLKKQEGTQ